MCLTSPVFIIYDYNIASYSWFKYILFMAEYAKKVVQS